MLYLLILFLAVFAVTQWRASVREASAMTANPPEGEIIEVGGYTVDEKVDSARRHLLHKQLKKHVLEDEWLSIDDDALSQALTRLASRAGWWIEVGETRGPSRTRSVAAAKAGSMVQAS